MRSTTLVDMLILAFLTNGPKHGYEIKKQMGLILGAQALVNNNQLYPALHRLVGEGAIAGEVQEQQGKPSRHVYRMTTIGREFFFELISQFSEAEAGRDDEFLFRVSQFGLLDSDTRRSILAARRKVVERRLAHRRAITEAYPLEGESPWIGKIFEFQVAQFSAELAWIGELERLGGQQHPVRRAGTPRAKRAAAREGGSAP